MKYKDIRSLSLFIAIFGWGFGLAMGYAGMVLSSWFMLGFTFLFLIGGSFGFMVLMSWFEEEKK